MRSTMAARDMIMAEMETLEDGYGYFRKHLSIITGLSDSMTLYALRELKRNGLVHTFTMFREDDGLIMGTGWGKVYKPSSKEGDDATSQAREDLEEYQRTQMDNLKP